MSKKSMILIVGIFLVVVGAFGAGFFILWSKMSEAIQQSAQAASPPEAVEQKAATLGPMIPLGSLTVNLADEGGKRYLRVAIELEIESEKLTEEINKRLPQVKDTILTILPTKRFEEIHSAEGKQQLRDGIMGRLNPTLASAKITNIYFTEFVVQ